MDRNIIRISGLVFVLTLLLQTAQSQVTGMWKTISDADGKENSIVEVYEHNGKLYGKIVRLIPDAGAAVCEKCPGDLKNTPITGLVFLKDLTKTASGGEGGSIMDPASGKTYKRSEEHTSELQSLAYLVCRLLLEKK